MSRPGIFDGSPACDDRPEADEAGDEKPIDGWKHQTPRHTRGDETKNGDNRDHHQEDDGEKLVLRRGTVDHAHVVAHRADDVVAGEKREKHGEGGEKRRNFMAFDRNEAREHGAAGIFWNIVESGH